MTTDRATKTPAAIYPTGKADVRTERAAEIHLWDADERVEAADWGLVDDSLEAACRALGAEPPETTADDFG
ncbi:hypothetical protein [Paludisphaera mucosa]|uniref:Uncharacterized protein n=1 Tax=Paludisphaera mucosa TaxID=3030827 RepID=A0ABT6F4U2_9BACT|nr:hypothetical protein [Paludisphaera mucosa]MDG3002602.1 hypothetical protein [Paludisphaera mucosa]